MITQHYKDKQDAINILQDLAYMVTQTSKGKPETSVALTVLYNAAYYLITGHAWYR